MGRGLKVAAALAAAATFSVALASAAVVQQGSLRITVNGQVQPYRLPRDGTAPIAVFLSGRIAAPDGSMPPQLQRMTVKVNRRGLLRSEGLPTCRVAWIQPGSSRRALERCGDALVGSGLFWAKIVLPDQRPYPTRGRLLLFNGKVGGRPVLFAHIYTPQPFINSFVVTFAIRHIREGTYGTELSASLPQALGSWGFVDRIKLTLRRNYRHHGVERSYFNAGCPAPAGTQVAAFPLARADFDFAEEETIGLTLTKTCRVAG
jgi:hypothetical protein